MAAMSKAALGNQDREEGATPSDIAGHSAGPRLGEASTSTSRSSQQRANDSQANLPLQSPCFVHSYLDSGLGTMRKDASSYFDASHGYSAEHGRSSFAQNLGNANTPAVDVAGTMAGRKIGDGKSQAMQKTHQGSVVASLPSPAGPGTQTKEHQRRHSMRHQPMHRSVQGAVEPDSDDNDVGSGTESDSCSSKSSGSYTLSNDDAEDDENRVRSLTRQLAETAVGVREMSKQLGRARVKSTINSVLIITKARDNHLIKLTRELAIWLMATPRNGRNTGLTVYVDSQLRTSRRFDAAGIKRDYPHIFEASSTSFARSQQGSEDRENGTASKSSSSSASHSSNGGSSPHGRHDEGLLRYWTSDMCSRSPHLFDMVVTLGGDGTVLFCSWLFQRIVPPVMPFALGSLGFLTNFDFSDYKKVMSSALDTGVRVNLRMRFTATVYRATLPSSSSMDKRRRRAIRSGKTGEIIMKGIQDCGWDSIETPLPKQNDLRGTFTEAQDNARDIDEDRRPPTVSNDTQCKKDKEVMCFSTRPVETFEVINDLVVDRGPSPYVSLLEVFGDEHHLTTAQADGLCISTPTGSTAYSLSAGGSLVHPEIPAILISPICPHTLSFRPMLLPDSMELRIAVPYNSRSTAWASFDGRGRVELKQGDHIKVTASKYPFPTVCADNQSTDWFESISRTLKWNERQRQKSFVVVEEGHEDDSSRNSTKKFKNDKKQTAEASDSSKAESKKATPSAEDIAETDDLEDDDDDEETEEQFDIDDASTAATRVSSPDGTERRRHSTTDLNGTSLHHHHHGDGNHHSHSHGHRSTPSSAATSTRNLLGMQPLTSAHSKSSSGREDPSDAGGSSHKHGVVSPSGRSLLDSPDRFGLAGPPNPPKAISERHLASADFRLDGGGSLSDPIGDKESGFEGDSSLPKGAVQANALRESITKMAEKNAKISDEHEKNRLYHNLKKRSSSGRVPTAKGMLNMTDDNSSSTSSRQHDDGEVRGSRLASAAGGASRRPNRSSSARSGSARSSGTALVVYGQDESDSDSTAEG